MICSARLQRRQNGTPTRQNARGNRTRSTADQLLVFLLIDAAPGDPTLMLLGEETNAAEVATARERWGLDRPSTFNT